jgi:hypothetical protein
LPVYRTKNQILLFLPIQKLEGKLNSFENIGPQPRRSIDWFTKRLGVQGQ